METLTEYVLLRGDAHSGAVRGLQHPDQVIEIDKKFTPISQSSWQKRIWNEVYIEGLKRFSAIVENAPLTIMDGGDLIHGTYHLDDVVPGGTMKNQFEIAINTFSPIYKLFPNVKQTILLIGTRAHALDEEGTVETVMRDRLRAGGHYTEVVGHGMISLNDIFIDASHVRAFAGKGHTRANAWLNYIKADMFDEILLTGQRPADLYLGWHFHDWAIADWTMLVQGEPIHSTGLICPPLTGMNGFARGATRSNPRVHIGIILLKIEGKRIDIIPHVKIYDTRDYIGGRPETIFYKYKGSPRS